MSELDIVVQSIRAARMANEASINALNAVERLLLGGEEESPEETIDQPIDLGVLPCTHKLAVKVETLDGGFLVCDCGHQELIDS